MDEFTIFLGRFGTPDYRSWTCSGVVTIGRAPACTIQLYHPMISRHHAMLALDDEGQFHVRDLNSKNGTTVNGHFVHGGVFSRPGNLSVLIGPFELTVVKSVRAEDDTMTSGTQSGIAAPARRIELDRGLRQVRSNGRVVVTALGDLEYRLLDTLDSAAPNVVPRGALGDRIWGDGQWDVYMLHNLVRRVRKKLEQADGLQTEAIVTVPGHGYRLA